MAILGDTVVIPTNQLAATIQNGGVNVAEVSGVDTDIELSRSIAYMLDIAAPLSKFGEVWGRPVRQTIAAIGEEEHAEVGSLRGTSESLAAEVLDAANETLGGVAPSRSSIQRRFGRNGLAGDSTVDTIESTLTRLDAVATSQTYAIEKHTQAMVMSHAMQSTAVRAYTDAGAGAINSLGTAVATTQRIQSVANTGQAYSATASRAIVQEAAAKSQQSSELTGYIASQQNTSIGKFI